MNPVVGLYVAKGESQIQMFLDKKTPYKNSVKVQHTVEGLEELHSYLFDLEHQTGMKPPVVLESPGHYHAPVVQFSEAREYIVIIVNPLVSYRATSSNIRKTKTDAIDAYHLGELYYKEDLEPQKKRGIQLLNLRHLTRQQENITGIMVQTKLQFQAILGGSQSLLQFAEGRELFQWPVVNREYRELHRYCYYLERTQYEHTTL